MKSYEKSLVSWRERRDLYPQGVASGDPRPESVILWIRRPPSQDSNAGLKQTPIFRTSAF